MSHYTVDYSTMQEPEKSEKAIADLKEWCTPKQWESMEKLAKEMQRERLQSMIELFVGASGFPVTAFLNKHYGETK